MQVKNVTSGNFLHFIGYNPSMDNRGRPSQGTRTELAERIHTARKRSGFSQQELALKMGVPQQTVANLERSSKVIKTDTLLKLCAILEVSADELLGIKPIENKSKAPEGRCRKVFKMVSDLPRRQQERIISVVEDLVSSSLNKAS
jgi:transcriptional regulator with XRE-family HTH domain